MDKFSEFITDRGKLLEFFPQIKAIADSEKDALGFWPDQQIVDVIRRGRIIALSIDGLLMGYIIYSGVFPNAKVQQIATVRSARRSGVASALVRRLVSELERLGFSLLKAEIAADLEGALKFYQKHGFVATYAKPGGRSRNRNILVHVRELRNDTLFTIANCSDDEFALEIKRRSASDIPYYAFDLNVYFDLVKERSHSEKARQLFGAALAHHVRLAVANEFVRELARTTDDASSDAILQLALRIPKMPEPDEAELTSLAAVVHEIVFVHPNRKGTGTVQALSDSRHLAHAALARASAFVTRDNAILLARNALLQKIGIDVVHLDELVDLLPFGDFELPAASRVGEGFEVFEPSREAFRHFLETKSISHKLIDEFCDPDQNRLLTRRIAVKEGGSWVAVGALSTARSVEPISRLLLYVPSAHPDSELFADHLLDHLVREACGKGPIEIELVHLSVPGQSAIVNFAKARGFFRSTVSNDYSKIALGLPVTRANWAVVAQNLRRRTALTMQNDPPSSASEKVSVTTNAGGDYKFSPIQLERMLGPTLIMWPGRCAALVPIRRNYADELLGTSKQNRFAFISNKDAYFFSHRSYVNAPRAAAVMRPERPILFYESKKQGGRGAVVAIARIVDAVIVEKRDIPDSGLRRLVVDDVDEFSQTKDVLLTTFDNVFEMPTPMPLAALRRIGAVDGSNLVSAVTITSEQVETVLNWGWSFG